MNPSTEPLPSDAKFCQDFARRVLTKLRGETKITEDGFRVQVWIDNRLSKARCDRYGYRRIYYAGVRIEVVNMTSPLFFSDDLVQFERGQSGNMAMLAKSLEISLATARSGYGKWLLDNLAGTPEANSKY